MIRIKPARPRKPPAPSEAQLHRVVSQFLRHAIRPPCFFTTFPAGGGGKARGGQLKGMGLRAGVPDLMIFVPRACGSLVIGVELKTARGRLSPVQQATQDALALAGVQCLTARSLDDVVDILRRADVPLHGRV